VRADRRYKQLIENGFDASFTALVEEIRQRDERDRNRSVAPLRPAEDALVVDSSDLSIDEVEATLWRYIQGRLTDRDA